MHETEILDAEDVVSVIVKDRIVCGVNDAGRVTIAGMKVKEMA